LVQPRQQPPARPRAHWSNEGLSQTGSRETDSARREAARLQLGRPEIAMLDVTAIVERLRGRIGIERGPVVRKIEKGALIKFAKAIGETNPLYFDEDYARGTRFGAIIAPPTYVSCFTADVLTGGLFDLDLPLKRSLHTDDIAETHQPIRVGDDIAAMARYADVYTKTGRNGPLRFQAADMTLTNQRSERVAIVRVVAVNFE
jgi:acyl dehydratase